MTASKPTDPRDVLFDAQEASLSLREAVRVLRRFWRYVRPYRGKFFLGICLLLFSVPLGQFALFLTRDVTNRALLATNLTADERWATVLHIVSLQAIFWFGSAVLSTWREVLEWYCSMRATFDLRLAFYRHLLRLPMSFLTKRTPGEHLFRSTTDMVSMFRAVGDGKEVGMAFYSNDVDPYDPGIMGMIVRSFPLLVETIYSLAWGAALLYLIDPMLSLCLVLYVVPFALISHRMFNRVRMTAFGFKQRTEFETGVLRDSIAGLRTLKAFARLPLQLKNYVAAVIRTRRRGVQLAYELVLTQNVVQGGMKWVFATSIYVYVAYRVMRGQATIGDWLATFLLVEAAQVPLEKFVQLLQLIKMQLVPAQRVLETLEEPTTLTDKPEATSLPSFSGGFEFRDVRFGYDPARPVLNGIDLKVEPGEFVGIVGPSGAGKSSLVSLLLRLYRADGGEILVDGENVLDIKLDSFLDHVGTVPQVTYLYSGTLADNVLFADPDAPVEQLERALTLAEADSFVSRLPLGIETEMGEVGVISGGERQRLGIARALLRDPKLLILDEATASLDPGAEEGVLRSIEKVRPGRTIIAIAHRLKAVTNCDRIVVLEAGRIVQTGTHRELIAQPGLYRDLWLVQAKDEAIEELVASQNAKPSNSERRTGRTRGKRFYSSSSS